MGILDPIRSLSGLVVSSLAITATCPAEYDMALDTKWYETLNLAAETRRDVYNKETAWGDMDSWGKTFRVLLYVSTAFSILSDSFDSYRDF